MELKGDSVLGPCLIESHVEFAVISVGYGYASEWDFELIATLEDGFYDKVGVAVLARLKTPF